MLFYLNKATLTLLSTALQTVIPIPDEVQTNFTVTSGGTAILHCPIQPGAFLQYYSVRWRKNGETVAQLHATSQHSKSSRYDIDRSSFSLIIDPVSISDSSESYECETYVRNPLTGGNRKLVPSRKISLTLDVQLGEFHDQSNHTIM